MGCVSGLASSQAGSRSPALPPRSVCSRGAQYPQGCWEPDRSRSHEQDRQGTGQGCQTELSKLGTRLELLGGARSWEEAPSLLEVGGGRALGCCPWHLHSPLSRVWSSHFDEPPENDLSPAASLFTYLPRPFTPWLRGPIRLARRGGLEGFPLLSLVDPESGRADRVGWGAGSPVLPGVFASYNLPSSPKMGACVSPQTKRPWEAHVCLGQVRFLPRSPCYPGLSLYLLPSSQAFSSFSSAPFVLSWPL